MTRLLELQENIELVAACEDLDSVLEVIEAEEPDVVLTDIRMPPDEVLSVEAADLIESDTAGRSITSERVS